MEQDTRYAEFYERALYNHILASQDPQNGAKTYFMATNPGHFKVYGTEDNSFWCCTGAGMENPARYNRFIWESDDEFIYLNLFAASRMQYGSLVVELESDFPEGQSVTLRVLESGDAARRLKIRCPQWLEGPLVVKSADASWTSREDGWLLIDSPLEKGMLISFELPFRLRHYQARDDEHKMAIMYGPLVLAARMGTDQFPANDIVGDHLSLMHQEGIAVPAITSESTDTADWLVSAKLGGLDFSSKPGLFSDGSTRVFSPYYRVHHERYALYLYQYSPDDWEAYRARQQAAEQALMAKTLDCVQPGTQQSEIEHGFSGARTNAGYLASVDGSWRDARGEGGYFSYRMRFIPGRDNTLIVPYYDRDGPMGGTRRHFTISVGGTRIATEDLEGTGSDRIIEKRYLVPAKCLENSPIDNEGTASALVRFDAIGEHYAGGIFGLRVEKN